jgi:hypothetical protein
LQQRFHPVRAARPGTPVWAGICERFQRYSLQSVSSAVDFYHEILMDGVVEADAMMSERLVARRYYRLNPPLARPTPLDDWKAIPQLIKTAEDFDLDPTFAWIEKEWK